MSEIITDHDKETNLLTKTLELEEGVILKAIRFNVGEMWSVYLQEDGKDTLLCAKSGREVIWLFMFVQDCINADNKAGSCYQGTWASYMWNALCLRVVTNFHPERFETIAGFIYMWSKENEGELAQRILDAIVDASGKGVAK